MTKTLIVFPKYFFEIVNFEEKINRRQTNQLKTLYLLVSSADIFPKQFEPRSGPTKCQTLSVSKLFDTQMAFSEEVFEKVDFEKISRRQINALTL